MNHLSISRVLQEAEKITFIVQMGEVYEAIEQEGKQNGRLADDIITNKLEARFILLTEDEDNIEIYDFYRDELENKMEEADKRLERHGEAREARKIVSVISDHKNTFEALATIRARELYEEFCLLAATINETETPTQTEEAATIKEEFCALFNQKFRGNNELKIDYTGMLFDSIRSPHSGKELATVAKMIYESGRLRNKPATFAAWYKQYCSILNLKILSYRPNQLKPNEKMRKKYSYL